jgi:hypothetical protein
MRKLFVLLFLSQISDLKAQQTAPLKFMSYAFDLCVTQKENLILSTRAGEVAISKSLNDNWKMISPGEEKNKITSSGLTIDQSTFFNSDTGFVSGFISNNDKYDIIFHTTDGGSTWKKIKFGQEGWVDHAVNLTNGEAWLSVAGSGIVFTKDYGFTWEKFDIPEKKQRFTQIYFSVNYEGIIGSLWNMIAYTPDNCSTWKILPTPLDQIKYKKIHKNNRPEIDKVAIFKNYFFVSQENLVFYTKKDSINWIALSDYTDFYTDAENSGLYFKTKTEDFIKSNDDFGMAFNYGRLNNIYDSKCVNGDLFTTNGITISHLQKNNTVITKNILTTDLNSIEPEIIGYTSKGIYGAVKEKIYIQKNFDDKWHYKFDLPFSVDSGNLSMPTEKYIVFHKYNDSLFYYNYLYGDLLKTTVRENIESFCKTSISKLIFQLGSSGCFHNTASNLVYTNETDEFVLGNQTAADKNKNLSLPENSPIIDSKVVEDFVKSLAGIYQKLATIKELGFSDEDYEKCKIEIIKFQENIEKNKKTDKLPFQFDKNNLDFAKLISLVDSIKIIHPNILNQNLMQLNSIWSTTTNWFKIVFVNDENQTLEIANYYYEPNALMFPWTITVNGIRVTNTSIEINHFLEKIYPAIFDKADKMDILRTLVKKLYNSKAG